MGCVGARFPGGIHIDSDERAHRRLHEIGDEDHLECSEEALLSRQRAFLAGVPHEQAARPALLHEILDEG